MSRKIKLVSLTTALSALAGPALLPEAAAATTTDTTHIANAGGKGATVSAPVGKDLMSFSVRDGANGVVVAQHVSHASHASHVSHASHTSSSF
jgi:hypothetical protein